MVEVTAVARSPIPVAQPVGVVEGWEVSARRSRAPLRIADATPLTKLCVRGARDGRVASELGVRAGHARRLAGGALACGLGPGEWLILVAPGGRDAIDQRLEPLTGDARELVTLIDLTHGRAMLRLTGADAPAALSKICAVDLHDSVTPDGTALRTWVAAVVTDIVRDDRGHQPSYLLGCEWSSGQYLFDEVVVAGREFGIDVDGFDP